MSMINVSNLTFAYEGSYDNVFENVSFQIDTDWKLGFTGRNGSGKSTLLKLLRGENIKYSGNLEKGSNLKISYVSQDTSFLSGFLSDYAEKWDIDESLFKTILRKMGFERSQLEKNMEGCKSRNYYSNISQR